MALDPALISFEARIGNTLTRAAEAGLDEELSSSLARFACVLTSGYLEEAVRTILGGWCGEKAHPHVHGYVAHELDRFMNPKAGKILDVVGHFSAAWKESLEHDLSDEERDAVNSVVNNRNQIAHGRNVGVSPHTMGNYFRACQSVVRKLDAVVGD